MSPHEKVTATIGGNDMIVVYGRPYTKDPKSGEPRKIWGGLVPYGKIWRLGADEATLLTTDKAIEMSGKEIAAGTYSLFLLPSESGATELVVNKQTGQWGSKYDESMDVARVPMKKETTEKSADQFTITLEDKGTAGGELKVMWDKTAFSAPFTVKK